MQGFYRCVRPHTTGAFVANFLLSLLFQADGVLNVCFNAELDDLDLKAG